MIPLAAALSSAVTATLSDSASGSPVPIARVAVLMCVRTAVFTLRLRNRRLSDCRHRLSADLMFATDPPRIAIRRVARDEHARRTPHAGIQSVQGRHRRRRPRATPAARVNWQMISQFAAPVESTNTPGDPLDLLFGQFGIERQREHATGNRFRLRQRWRRSAGNRRLQMAGNRVMDAGADSLGTQVVRQLITARRKDRVVMINVLRCLECRWSLDRRAGQRRVIDGGQCSAAIVPAVEMRKLYPQHRSLDFIEPGVEADLIVSIARAAAMIAQRPQAIGQCGVVRGDGAGLTIGAEILREVEAKAPRDPE